jgi:cyclopropane fatty-acyl-phospholipid synthase-like methyltransferase
MVDEPSREVAESEPAGAAQTIPPPSVSASLYDTDYYSNWCAGFDEWNGSEGARPAALYQGSLQRARMRPGDVVVDLGTGRGELLAVAVEMGAACAIGVEYSLEALAFAQRTLAAHAMSGRAVVMAADTRRLPLRDSLADLVVMLDIVEHLSPAELHLTLTEARRVLRPGARVFVHTMPTRTIYDVTYRLQRLVVPGRRRRWPADPRREIEHLMHINEQTKTSLTRSLNRAGFSNVRVERGAWIHNDFVPQEKAKQLYQRLAAHRLTAGLGVADLWAEATCPPG